MNELVQVVSGMLTGEDFKTVRLGGRFYTIKSPWTVTLARALGKLSVIDIPDNASRIDAIMMAPGYAPKVAAFIAVLAVGNVNHWGPLQDIRYHMAYRDAMRTTETEKKDAFVTCLALINAADFFVCASLGVKLADQMAKAKQES